MQEEKERRKVVNVSDRPAESKLNLNNIFLFLILGNVAWAGTNIEIMKRKLSDIVTAVSLNTNEITHVKIQVSEIKEDVESNTTWLNKIETKLGIHSSKERSDGN